MDGHARWARAQGLPIADGHEAMGRALETTVRLSCALGIRVLSAFAFSHENLGRPKAEVDYLMEMLERLIHDNVFEFSRQGVRLQVIGDSSQRPASLNSAAREGEEATRNNSRLVLQLLICYSGRWDIVQACQELARKAQGKLLSPDDIDESLLASSLKASLAHEFSCPDLIIRTSGEQRLSNFLLWQSAFSELFFTNVLWPDFGEDEYLQLYKH
uniref:Alkyl transferase n=1 Tax=Arundo donax TaxID=35708 RepID=A0A0A8ZWR8_ARUDO